MGAAPSPSGVIAARRTGAIDTTTGKAEAFALLKDARNEFERSFTALQKLPASTVPFLNEPESITATQLNALDAAWSALKLETDKLKFSNL